jgi:hypothetical protein
MFCYMSNMGHTAEKQNYFHAMICGYCMSLSSLSIILLPHHIHALNLKGVTNITHEAYGSTSTHIVVLLIFLKNLLLKCQVQMY